MKAAILAVVIVCAVVLGAMYIGVTLAESKPMQNLSRVLQGEVK